MLHKVIVYELCDRCHRSMWLIIPYSLLLVPHLSIYTLRFQFVRVVRGDIITPNTHNQHGWTGVAVKHPAGQGAVYVRSTIPLTSNKVENQTDVISDVS